MAVEKFKKEVGKLEMVNETKIKDSQYNNLLFNILNYGSVRNNNNQIKLDHKTELPENLTADSQSIMYSAIENLVRHGEIFVLFIFVFYVEC